MRHVLPFLALALTSSACTPSTPAKAPSAGLSSPPVPPPGRSDASADRAAPAESTLPDGSKPMPLSPDDLTATVRSTNAIGLDLYAKARVQPGNVALSPLSIATALTMAWAGARGATANEMKRVLHAARTPEKAAMAYRSLLESLHGPDRKFTLRVASRLFAANDYAFEKPYLDHTRTAFGAPLEPVDFKHAAEEGRVSINAWVAKETQNRIEHLIAEGALTDQTRLLLVNAIYFLGNWSMPFNEGFTAPAPFHGTRSETKSVPTMHQVAHFRFAAVDDVKLLEMGYEGGHLAMTLVLPDAMDGIESVEKQLSPSVLERWTGGLRSVRVKVSLPRFDVNPPEALPLGDALVALGMPLAFDRERADFTAIANPRHPEDRLCLSQVFHKAFVKVNEKGTEAAAATGAVMVTVGATLTSKPPPEFRADHPFLFFLRDVRSGALLFVGRVSDPVSS